MTRALLTSTVTFLLLSGCAGTLGGDDLNETDSPPATDTEREPALADTGADDTGDDGPGFTVTFTDARYKVERLVVQKTAGLDLDGDGAPDNKVGALLDQISEFGPNFSALAVETVNERIADLLLEEAAIVLARGRHEGQRRFGLELVVGERTRAGDLIGLPSSYDDLGKPTQRLSGRFVSEDDVVTTEGTVQLPLQFWPDEPVILIRTSQVRSEATIDAGSFDGIMGGAFPVEALMADMVEPLVRDNVAAEQQESTLGLVRTVLTTAADLQDDGGNPALSGSFRIVARTAEWRDPVE